ncbi:hypothetical protein AGMMS49975_16260 [Clostridia bacterium]|nr:hypothetical protein AGMMS49975_16260 [Clostridia bacterium]
MILCTICAVSVFAQEPEVKSPSVILIDAKTGIPIYEKNATERLYPASITKLMTMLLIMEYIDKNPNALDERVYFSDYAVNSLPWDSSGIGMIEGESLTLEQTIYAVLLASANEASNAAAEHIAGSVPAFVDKMNEKVLELGCVNTRFANPHGLEDDGHYTCAYDMSLIMRECVTHKDFEKYISTAKYEIPPTEIETQTRYMVNTNKLIQPNSPYYNPEVVGGKTGYTTPAMHTLVTFSRRGGLSLICVCMHANKNEPYEDTTALINYGFEQFADIRIFDSTLFNDAANLIPVYDGEGEFLENAVLGADGNITMELPKGAADRLVTRLDVPDKSQAPVSAFEVVGKADIFYDADREIPLGSADVFARNSVQAPAPPTAPDKSFLLTILKVCGTLAAVFAAALTIALLRMKRGTKNDI